MSTLNIFFRMAYSDFGEYMVYGVDMVCGVRHGACYEVDD